MCDCASGTDRVIFGAGVVNKKVMLEKLRVSIPRSTVVSFAFGLGRVYVSHKENIASTNIKMLRLSLICV